MSAEQSAENDAAGCHPLLVCTDRPELCPPACAPVVRNAGTNAIPHPLPESEQLVLDIRPLVTPERVEGQTIQERFEAFHQANPWVYAAFCRLADDWIAKGRTRLGVGMLTEVLRWEYGRQTVGDPFKINNDYRSRYVRLMISDHPEYADVFETRALRAVE